MIKEQVHKSVVSPTFRGGAVEFKKKYIPVTLGTITTNCNNECNTNYFVIDFLTGTQFCESHFKGRCRHILFSKLYASYIRDYNANYKS